METILFCSLLRNNENYIPYMKKMFKEIENKLSDSYNFKYLIYTNNNTDNTYQLLTKDKWVNMKIINDDLGEEFNKKHKVEKLYELRENFLHVIKKENFDYVIMYDSDIYFNSYMIIEMMRKYKNNKIEALTTNTISQNNPFYYDFFSLVDEYGETISLDKKKDVINFHQKCLKLESFPVKSAFGGFFLTSHKYIKTKKLSYIEGNRIDKNICEHIPFNKNFEIEFVTDVTPIRVKLDYKYKHRNAFERIQSNKTDLRNFEYYSYLFYFLIFSIVFVTYFYFTRFKNYTILYILFTGVIFLTIFNFFEEIF